MEIRPGTPADLPAVVALHRAAFPRHFLTGLGPAFLRHYYGAVLADPRGILLLGCEPDAGAFGFVAGFVDPPGFYAALRRRRFGLMLRALPALIRAPGRLARLRHNRRRVATAAAGAGDDEAHVAELCSLGVAPAHQNRGAGRALVAAFEGRAHARGAVVVTLTTDAADDNPANRFYRGLGFAGAPFALAPSDRPMLRYAKALAPCDGVAPC